MRRQSGPEWLREMRHAFEDARFSAAASQYDTHRREAPFEATLLRARIYFKQPDYPAAIAILGGAPQPDKTFEAERLMLLAVAYSRTNRFDESDELFGRADGAGASRLFPSEFPYLHGRRFLEEHKPARARQELETIRHFKSGDARVLGDLLETGILSQEERYLDEAGLLMDLIRFIDSSQRPFVEENIHAVRTLACLARELDSAPIRDFIQRRVREHQWTDDFRPHQFQTLKAVGWCYALQGDYFNGLRYLKMAGKIAPSSAWQAMTLLDRAYLARCFGETRWSHDELWEADDILMSTNWRETNDEERIALLLAAELYAPVDSGKAAAYLARFSELRDDMNPLVLFRYDRRLSALVDYASGFVDMHFGNQDAAIASLRRAWKIYSEVGYDWRAGRTALRLYQITSNNQWFARASEKLTNYQKSWLSEELRAEKPQGDGLPRLSPAQRRVLGLIYAGKSTREIVAETGRSPNTIQNHIKAILKAFDLPNRTMVVAELAKKNVRDL